VKLYEIGERAIDIICKTLRYHFIGREIQKLAFRGKIRVTTSKPFFIKSRYKPWNISRILSKASLYESDLRPPAVHSRWYSFEFSQVIVRVSSRVVYRYCPFSLTSAFAHSSWNAMAQEENDAISALTGFSINHVLGDLSLPSGDGLSNRLGISGLPTLKADQIYNNKWVDEEAVGPEQGQDWEDEIDREMREEGAEHVNVKQEELVPSVRQKEKRTRIIKRYVERPKSVYERFPAFEKDKTLDFSELFKGYTVHKSRLSKRPYQGTL